MALVNCRGAVEGLSSLSGTTFLMPPSGLRSTPMGSMASAECTSCGLKAEHLCLDVGVSPIYSFVSNALSYCLKCVVLTAEPRLNSAASIRHVTKYLADSHPEARHLVEIAEAIATAIDRKCGKFGTERKDVQYREGSAKPSQCPRCSKKTLRLEMVGIWD